MTFSRSAHVYDLRYEKGLGRDYEAEADAIAELVPGARSLLDVACGTGLHLRHLEASLEYRAAFEAARLDVAIDGMAGPMGRGLATGRRPG